MNDDVKTCIKEDYDEKHRIVNIQNVHEFTAVCNMEGNNNL